RRKNQNLGTYRGGRSSPPFFQIPIFQKFSSATSQFLFFLLRGFLGLFFGKCVNSKGLAGC
ncbi:hypothetical protein ACQRC3_08860, partial [Streptococcus alactolyticus]|uniref:hypothetical protein n=1 Tax=Streptococcus alactolyticus TaxID=29389 RepID=UPI003D05E7A5